ncbi:ATP-binding protein [Candidatus Saccharibacteria bacterium]|nr:ATP-binding protein [Candidatus Saccharibacteria bacterium]
MPTILVALLVILSLISAGAAFAYLHTRKLWREQKNFERGLKMVPLLIHLPPSSSDTEVGARDARDVIDETISKAETLYDIISSTAEKGFKSKFYGQRHFAFEIVGVKGFVHFYAAVPVALVEVVQQAIVSAYPSARLEEVAEHNIFSPVGRTSGTMGGELVLKENTSYPIATFQELKRDTMQSILNALSTLDKEDGAGIQILLRPANKEWRKNSIGIAQKKRKNESESGKGKIVFGWFGQLLYAPIRPPESKDEKKKDEKPLSGIDQSLIEGIEEKTRHAGYEVCIRIVSSSNVSQKAQSVLKSLVATFALFDSPGKNGFKFVPAKDIDSFITSYILRFFPPENNGMILNSIELATLFHFPDQSSIPTTQLERQASKQVDGPRNIPEEGLLLGYNVFRGVKKKINLELNDRRRHVYAVGQTGTGKSTFLENMALQDMLNGDGFAFIDPHGDTAEKLLSMVPKERTEDVIYFCPADMDYPLGLNLFEFDHPDQQDFLIQEAINMLYKLYDPQHQGIIGPRYEHWFRMAARTIMADPAGATFIDIPKVFTDNQYAKEKLAHVKDKVVLDFWNKEMAQTSDYHKSEVLGWFVSKFGAFMANEMMRNIIGQVKSSFDLREIMDNKKILLVNLSKGRTGELNSKLLGMIFVMKFQAAAMSRASIPEDERKDFALYVDEFQNFSTDSFASILSEARKYRLNLIVANQFTTQLSDEIRDAVFGNVGTIVSFRVGTADAEFLVKQFTPLFDTDDLQRVPNYNAIVRMLIGGIPTQPFSMAGLPPLGNPSKELGDALKQLSAVKHGRPRAVIEKEIFDRLQTLEPIDTPANKPVAGRMGGGAPQQPQRPSTGSSFLDDWMHKKATNSFRAPSSPFNKQQPPAQGQPQQSMPPQGDPGAFQQPITTPSANVPQAPQIQAQEAVNQPQAQQQPAPGQITEPAATSQQEGLIDHKNSSDDETTISIR